MNAHGKPQRIEKTADILLLTTLLVPETQDMPCHDSIWHMSRNLCQLGSVEPHFEPRPKNLSLDFLSDSVCMHPGVGRLSTISGIVQFHILSNSGWLYKQIGGYTTIFAMISQPTPPPRQGTSPRNKALLIKKSYWTLGFPLKEAGYETPAVSKNVEGPSPFASRSELWCIHLANTRLKTFRKLEDTCIEI